MVLHHFVCTISSGVWSWVYWALEAFFVSACSTAQPYPRSNSSFERPRRTCIGSSPRRATIHRYMLRKRRPLFSVLGSLYLIRHSRKMICARSRHRYRNQRCNLAEGTAQRALPFSEPLPSGSRFICGCNEVRSSGTGQNGSR